MFVCVCVCVCVLSDIPYHTAFEAWLGHVRIRIFMCAVPMRDIHGCLMCVCVCVCVWCLYRVRWNVFCIEIERRCARAWKLMVKPGLHESVMCFLLVWKQFIVVCAWCKCFTCVYPVCLHTWMGTYMYVCIYVHLMALCENMYASHTARISCVFRQHNWIAFKARVFLLVCVCVCVCIHACIRDCVINVARYTELLWNFFSVYLCACTCFACMLQICLCVCARACVCVRKSICMRMISCDTQHAIVRILFWCIILSMRVHVCM